MIQWKKDKEDMQKEPCPPIRDNDCDWEHNTPAKGTPKATTATGTQANNTAKVNAIEAFNAKGSPNSKQSQSHHSQLKANDKRTRVAPP